FSDKVSGAMGCPSPAPGKLTFSSTRSPAPGKIDIFLYALPPVRENGRFLLGWMGLERVGWVEGTWEPGSCGVARLGRAMLRQGASMQPPDTLKREQRAT
ncbi:MAG: hypothetical protein KDK99_22475, partial [Verrucomicrobiales bacterium]|nr:hypothetical protein [Verrucomicrobiales bacterium]